MAKSNTGLNKNYYFNTNKDKEFFFQNVALMVASGINIIEAIDKFSQEYKRPYIQELCEKFKKDIENGNSFTQTLEKYKIIPEHSLSIIKISEAAGNLPDALKMVIEQLQKEREFRAQLRSVAIYPIVVVVILIVVTLGMGLFVIPKFSEIYKSLNVELPLLTKIIIEFGSFMNLYGYIVAPLTLILMAVAVYFLFVRKSTRRYGQQLLMVIPGISTVILETEVSRMAYVLSSLLSRGFQVLEAVAILKSSTSLYKYQKYYEYLYDSINQGVSLKKCFSDYKGINKLFPLYVRQLIGTSEETGELTNIMAELNVIYAKKNELSSKNLTVILEPFLLVTIAVAVGVITIAVLLPMYNLMGNITDLASPSNKGNLQGTNQQVKEPLAADNSTRDEPRLLIVYMEPGTFNVYDEINGNAIAVVGQGQVYPYSDSKNGWYKIKLNNQTQISGWIDGKYTKLFSY
jgi:type IV pilus assembly protein PilC